MSEHVYDTAASQAADMSNDTHATVEEAAKLLGLSENAVRKRIERGSLNSEKIDGVRYVVLDADMSEHAALSAEYAGHVTDDMPPGMPGDTPLIVERLENEVEFLREELRRKDHLLAAALERIPAALEEARETPSEAPETVTPEAEGVETPLAEKQRSWLHRFFFGP